MKNYDVIILGGGAAGLFCAMRASQLGKSVLILEKNDRVGAKILISGGGRCNFTNRNISADHYISNNPHFCISALKSYTQDDFIALIDKHNIGYHEKTLGQLFCDQSSQQIIDMLLTECCSGNVEIYLARDIEEVTKNDYFHVRTQHELVSARSLVLATGGLSIPKLGATDLSYNLARQFDLPVTETRPALVPLVFAETFLDLMRDLAGVSLPVKATKDAHSFLENMVFTHRGLSGPAILQISSYWKEKHSLLVDLLPSLDAMTFLIERKKLRPKAELKTILSEVLPSRLAESLTTSLGMRGVITDIPDKMLKEMAAVLNAWKIGPSGTEGYAKAEVTRGGISTHALSSKTMEAPKIPGLYVIGEAVDVTGWLGGYNFQWAWSSAWAAGSAIGASQNYKRSQVTYALLKPIK